MLYVYIFIKERYPSNFLFMKVCIISYSLQEGDFTRVNGYEFNQGVNYPLLLQSLASTGFEASNLSEAIKIVNQMVDAIITATGFEEDVVKCLSDIYIDDGAVSAAALRSQGLSRVGKLLVHDDSSSRFEAWVKPILDQMLMEQKEGGMLYTDWAFTRRLGLAIKNKSSYLYWASKNDISVYCPWLLSGSLGSLISSYCPDLRIDIVHGNNMLINQVVNARPRKTGMIVLGGGGPRERLCQVMKNFGGGGADYAVFIGSAKESDYADYAVHAPVESKSVEVICDPAIAFPLLVAETFAARGE